MKSIQSLKSPTWFQKIQYVTDPIGYWEAAFQKYPEVFWAKGVDFGTPIMIFSTPLAAREIIENRDGHLTATSFTSELRAIFGNSSFFTLEGDRHLSMRKLLMPLLHGKQVRSYGQLISDLADKVMYQLPTHQPFCALEVAQEISMQVTLQILFGFYQEERYQQIKNLMTSMVSLFGSNIAGIPLFFRFLQKDLGSVSPWRRFVSQRQQMEQLIYTEIAERRANPDSSQTDILALLLSVRDEEGNPLTNEELLGQLLSLLFAGNEATASSIAWSWYWVYRNPEIQAKLLEEVNSLGDSPDPISVSRLPYLTAVCNETLRMYPVTMFLIPRRVKSATQISGYSVKPGTLVTVGTYQIHHREDIYPNPKTFKPERFIDRQFSPYEFIPFGGGVRSCIGAELATYQMKLTLATILSRYELELASKKTIKPQRRNTVLIPMSLRMVKKS